MTPKDIAVILILTLILVVGAYQFYFLPQRKPFIKEKKLPITFFDKAIPFSPIWVWIYSGLYYPYIFSLVLSFNSFHQFAYTAFNFFVLLVIQMIFFFLFPIKTPDSWRDLANSHKSFSAKFLRYIYTHDSSLNCFPSMHSSVAVLVTMHLKINLTWDCEEFLYVFPILIGLSCLFIKQHYLIDILGGYILGYLVFLLFNHF